jgi:hypothetical protein
MAIQAAPALPTREELDRVQRVINDLLDGDDLLDDVVKKVLAVTNYEGRVPVTLEEIGALTLFVRTARWMLAAVVENLDRIDNSIEPDLGERVFSDGECGSVPQYDPLGKPNYPRLLHAR